MAWTFQQFDEGIEEIAALGPERWADGCALREVTLRNGETFLIDVDLIFASRDDAEVFRAQLD
jgi:hypothetical protein